MGKQRAVVLTENGWAISAMTKKPKEAWLLAKFLSGPDGAAVLTKATKAIPALKSLPTDTPKPFLDAVAYARPFFTSPKLLEMLALFQAEYPAAAVGQKPLKDTLDSMCAKIDAVLAQK
jgi:ABC-type glycerol-3-phosphate transport system substrate-binding protein